jgi:hypothetical protein
VTWEVRDVGDDKLQDDDYEAPRPGVEKEKKDGGQGGERR